MTEGDPTSPHAGVNADRPTILVVDDDGAALGRAEHESLRRYSPDHRVVARMTPGDALAELEALLQEGGELALALVDQRMPSARWH